MSQSCRGASLCSLALPMLLQLLLLSASCDADPLGLFSLFDPVGLTNGTSILGALALAHAEHTLAKLNALAALAGIFTNDTLGFFG